MLRLSELEAPLDDIEFPNGMAFRAIPFDAEAFALQKQLDALGAEPETEAERTALGFALLRRCVPDASDEALSTLSAVGARAIILHCRRQLDLVLATLGNVRAGMAVASPTRRSSLPTKKRTSSRALRARSVADSPSGSASTVSPTT